MSKVDKICSRCGSGDVVKDAWAQWDKEAQEWVLLTVFDHEFCQACENAGIITDAPLEDTTLQLISSDEFAVCHVCSARLDPDIDPETNDNRVVDEDDDGPIYLGTCKEHGAFRFQFWD